LKNNKDISKLMNGPTRAIAFSYPMAQKWLSNPMVQKRLNKNGCPLAQKCLDFETFSARETTEQENMC
jgi:hypothetical protein